MRYLSILCTALFLITSCGGGSSSGGGGETIIDTGPYYYQPGVGDEIVYKITIATDPPYYKKSTFILENLDIPDQYNYEALEGLEGNPHLLEAVTAGLDPDNFTVQMGNIYYNLDGAKIIDDQYLTYLNPAGWIFTNVDHTTITGDEEPESVVAGREYESTIEEILFDHSDPPVGVGTRTITTTIVPQDIVSVTVLGTTYEALRITTESFSEETIDGSTTILTGSGTLWLGRNTGLVKTQMEYTSEEEGEDPVSYHYLVELFDITISSDAVLPASLQTSLPARTVPLHSFMKNISPTHHPFLP